MEFQYKKAMEEHNLKVSDLPEDAQTGIDNINDVLKAIDLVEKRGKKPTEKTLKKIKAMDKWVYYEILDYLQGTDKNEDEMPEDSEEIVDELNEQIEDNLIDYENEEGQEEEENEEDEEEEDEEDEEDFKENSNVELGLQIEVELENLFNSGKTEMSYEELKRLAKKTSNLIFETYEEGEQNGVSTSKYSLLETSTEQFKLTKN